MMDPVSMTQRGFQAAVSTKVSMTETPSCQVCQRIVQGRITSTNKSFQRLGIDRLWRMS